MNLEKFQYEARPFICIALALYGHLCGSGFLVQVFVGILLFCAGYMLKFRAEARGLLANS